MPAPRQSRRAPGKEFAALMEQYGLKDSNAGADVAAKLLRLTRNTIQMYYQRGIDRNYLELLSIHLAWMREDGEL